MGGGGGAVRGIVAVGTPPGGLGLGDLGDGGFFFIRDKLFPEPDEERPRSRLGGGGGGPLLKPGPRDLVGGGGGGPLLLLNRFEEKLEFDIFRPTEGGGAGGVTLVGGGGGGPLRFNPSAGPELPRIEFRPGGGGGGPFLVGGGGPALFGGGGGGFAPRPPGVARGN